MAEIIAQTEYLSGHLRYGHMELTIDDSEELEYFKSLSDKEQRKYMEEEGKLIVDEYRLNDYELQKCEIFE